MALSQVPWLEYLDQLCDLIKQVGYTKALATGAGVYVAYKVVYALYVSPLCGIPGPLLARLTSKRSELIGAMGAQPHKGLEDYEKYGDIYVYQPRAVSISNPADIRAVLGSQRFRKGDVYKAIGNQAIPSVVSARDPEYASMRRRQIGPYFSNTYLAKMEKAILEHGILAIKGKWDGLLAQSGGGQIEVNYHQIFFYAAFDTIGSLAFGREFGALKNNDLTAAKWVKDNFTYSGIRLVFPLLTVYPFSLMLSRLKRSRENYKNHAIKSVTNRKELLAELEANGELDKKPVDLLQGFLEAADSESKIRMTTEEVLEEVVALISAGSETSSNTLTWTVHLLMLYPDCYKRTVEEVRSAFAKDHLITFSDAKAKLPYLEACLYESLRRLPVTGGQLPRVVPSGGAVLCGHFIPGGNEVYINYTGANMNKSYWKDPYLFDPTRFLNNDEAKRNVFTFSYGVRVCPGRQLAWNEMFTILANILKDYDLSLPGDYTLHGPNVLDDRGYPKVMESKHFVTSAPANIERDCRLIVSKPE